MEATRIVRTIEQIELTELSSYIGQTVEIIIFPISEESPAPDKVKFFEIIDQCAGHIEPWTREELYER
jgi:hypothetical protein